MCVVFRRLPQLGFLKFGFTLEFCDVLLPLQHCLSCGLPPSDLVCLDASPKFDFWIAGSSPADLACFDASPKLDFRIGCLPPQVWYVLNPLPNWISRFRGLPHQI